MQKDRKSSPELLSILVENQELEIFQKHALSDIRF